MTLDLAAELILALWGIVVALLLFASTESKHGNA